MKKCTGTGCGWIKEPESPVLGGDLGTCFDISVLREQARFRMYFSWRPEKCIAVTESDDGIHWSAPVKCIEPRKTREGWEDLLNRPSVLRRGNTWHMWYTGQRMDTDRTGTSQIFYAASSDGVHFERVQDEPVVFPDTEWESTSVMNPSVIWNPSLSRYQMWYCAGAQYEPRAIAYAESEDGIRWVKWAQNPVFEADPNNSWEQHKTAGCQVILREKDYLLFYIGYFNEDYAQIGMARSPDGKTNWTRFEGNPIIAPDPDKWDGDACYKPFAMEHDGGWMLWYNGRKGPFEQIGLARHDKDLGF